jgi:hypothetical protein
MERKNIPCVDCLCLGACKQKRTIICSILYDFMEDNVVYEEPSGDLQYGKEFWNQVDSFFQRDVINVEIKKNGKLTPYTILGRGWMGGKHNGPL